MNRRRSSQAFSLFAFQDIITSVTAIVLLFTLLLVLALVSRKSLEASAVTSSTAAELASLAEEMGQQELAGLGSLESAETVDQALTIAESLKQAIEQSISEVEKELLRVQSQQKKVLAQLMEERDELRRELDRRRDVNAARRQTVASQRRSAALGIEISRLGREVDALEKQAEVPQGPPVVRFRDSTGTLNGSWLVILGQGRITATQVTSNETVSWGSGSAVAGFSRWIQGKKGEVRHCVVLVRPSGLRWFGEVAELIQENGIAIGKEVIGEHQKVTVAGEERVRQ